MTIPSGFSVSLPPWLIDEAASLPDAVVTPTERIALVNELADRNWREGNGGPFAAAVVDRETGALVSVGVNVVLQEGLSSVHAEVVALSLAQVAAGGWDLADGRDLELVVNWRPCAMCFGATIWSGVRSLRIAGSGQECEALTGFDEGPLTDDWRVELEARGIAVAEGPGRSEAVAVFAAYGASGSIVYNAAR